MNPCAYIESFQSTSAPEADNTDWMVVDVGEDAPVAKLTLRIDPAGEGIPQIEWCRRRLTELLQPSQLKALEAQGGVAYANDFTAIELIPELLKASNTSDRISPAPRPISENNAH